MKLVAPLVVALALAACNGGTSSVPSTGASQLVNSAVTGVPQWKAQHLARADCPQVVGRPTCMALRVTEKNGVTPLACSPTSTCGFTPAELEAAYNLTSKLGNGSGSKVALIEAGDLANAASDLSTYRTQYGLGTASFFKYNENGQQSNYPPSCEDYGWCGETALDIDMVSASCPKCTIYLMEAKDGSSISDFEQAEKEAVTLGATIVSNSWSCPKNWDCGDSNFGSYFSASGVAYLASNGDDAYNTIGGPSALASVIGVGGTQLEKSGSTYSEVIWPDASAGCASPSIVGSPGVPKPSWQHDPDCAYRTVGDVSSEAGCSPGVAVYVDVYGGWAGYCGTSVSSPFTAGVVGLKGNPGQMHGGKRIWSLTEKQHKAWFHHVTSGDGGSCPNYLCGNGAYKKYYTAPGGWGSPKGIKGY
jgi:subtilase family serine protease